MNASYGQWTGQSYGQAQQPVDVFPSPGIPVAQTAQTPAAEMSAWEFAIQALPVAQGLTEAFKDKYKAVQVAQLKLRTAQAQGASSIHLGKLQANYNAALRAYQKQLEAEQARSTFRTIGQVGGVTAVGIGAAVILFILVRAFR